MGLGGYHSVDQTDLDLGDSEAVTLDVDATTSMSVCVDGDGKTTPRATCFKMIGLNLFVSAYAAVAASLTMLVLPVEAAQMFPDAQAVALGGLLGIAGLAQLVGPVAGLFSDRSMSPYGRRRPMLFSFAALALISLLALYVSPRQGPWRLFYFIAFAALNLCLNVCYAASAGLVPDQVPKAQLGEASGVIAVLTSLGSLLGIWMVGFAIDVHDAYLALAGVLLGVALVQICAVRDAPRRSPPPPPLRLRDIAAAYTINSTDFPDFFWVLVSRLCYYVGISAQAFMLYFLRDVIGRDDDAKLQTALVSIIGLGCSCIVSVPCGHLSDRIGRKPLVYIACVCMACTYVGWSVSTDMWHVFLWAAVFGIGNGSYLSVDYALACDTMPDSTEHAAQALGIWGVAAFIGTTLGPCIHGPVLYLVSMMESPQELGIGDGDPTLTSVDDGDIGVDGGGSSEDAAGLGSLHYAWAGYCALLAIGGWFVLLSAIVLRFVKGAK